MKHVVVIYEIGDEETLPEIPGARVVYSGVASGVKVQQKSSGETAFIRYARWFDKDSSTSWNGPEHEEYNWVFLRQGQTWANDMLKARGHMFLNEVQGMLGLPLTALGAVVGWYWGPDTEDDVFIDFGCWEQKGHPLNSQDPGAILLDFNVQGPILQFLS